MFLDIVEQVNVLMNSKGSVLRCDVNGKMIMKAYLSGMPEVKIGLNDRLDVRSFMSRPSHVQKHVLSQFQGLLSGWLHLMMSDILPRSSSQCLHYDSLSLHLTVSLLFAELSLPGPVRELLGSWLPQATRQSSSLMTCVLLRPGRDLPPGGQPGALRAGEGGQLRAA